MQRALPLHRLKCSAATAHLCRDTKDFIHNPATNGSRQRCIANLHKCSANQCTKRQSNNFSQYLPHKNNNKSSKNSNERALSSIGFKIDIFSEILLQISCIEEKKKYYLELQFQCLLERLSLKPLNKISRSNVMQYTPL